MRPWTSVLPRLTHGPARSCPPSVSSPKYRRGFLCLRHGSARFGSLSVYPLVSTSATTRCRPGIFRMCLPHTRPQRNGKAGGGGRSESEVREVRKKAKKAKKCCCPMMSKTRPSSRSMGATPGGARGARGAQSAACATWRRATTRGGGEERLGKERRARRRTTIARREEENFFKARKRQKFEEKLPKPRFSVPL